MRIIINGSELVIEINLTMFDTAGWPGQADLIIGGKNVDTISLPLDANYGYPHSVGTLVITQPGPTDGLTISFTETGHNHPSANVVVSPLFVYERDVTVAEGWSVKMDETSS